jgi:polysaccharide biosynthesis/export protein
MKRSVRSLVNLGLISGLSMVPAFAQQQPAAAPAGSVTPVSTQAPADPQLKLSPEKQLEQFQPAVDEEYTLGAGDEIGLDFPGRPELTKKYTVGPDGRITLPLAGQVTVANLTREQAAKAIVDALSNDYTNLTVTVNIEKYGSNKVTVIGNVKNPGTIYFDTTPTLLDAISRGGLLPTPSYKDGLPDECMIYRGNNQVFTVQLRDLLRSGSAMADMRLRRNDIIFVPSQSDRFVSVLGQVKNPGSVPLTSDSNLPSLIAQAGGLTDGAGNNPHIMILSKANGTTRVVNWKDINTPKGLTEVALQPGDIVSIPKTGFYKSTYVLERLSPMTSLATLLAVR